MPIVDAVLMCHAPIVIPAIGGSRAGECEQTTTAMGSMAQRLVDRDPEVLVCLSPHTPRLRSQFGVMGQGPKGDFRNFRAPDVTVGFSAAEEAAASIVEQAGDDAVLTRADPQLDHGAGVPLWFVEQAGFSGPTVLVSLPWNADHRRTERFGLAVARAADQDGRRWAILASGDMSHCLFEGAPSGYHPDGPRFDRAFVALLNDQSVASQELGRAFVELDALRERACEDVVDTVEVACAATGYSAHRSVLSYEGPFGVGYTVASLTE